MPKSDTNHINQKCCSPGVDEEQKNCGISVNPLFMCGRLLNLSEAGYFLISFKPPNRKNIVYIIAISSGYQVVIY